MSVGRNLYWKALKRWKKFVQIYQKPQKDFIYYAGENKIKVDILNYFLNGRFQINFKKQLQSPWQNQMSNVKQPNVCCQHLMRFIWLILNHKTTKTSKLQLKTRGPQDSNKVFLELNKPKYEISQKSKENIFSIKTFPISKSIYMLFCPFLGHPEANLIWVEATAGGKKFCRNLKIFSAPKIF